ncbi:guanine nucleotide-binding -like 3 [Pelobates cultripes]|uniref:Guanine nucleotide-binding protein-like 3 n=1 Tax=Pelobates cultripes TaxID=61616 RepID=A0AAD1WJ68_PELCU|nr:guanine nucleotide-binding -like 3 [Pelobates cultripes]
MRRPKLRKASKRMTCSKRFKIQKKVREHKRKVKKQAKNSGSRKQKKDLSIPNDAPFKEAILREAELRKERREELKKAQKLERQKELAKKRNLEAKRSDPAETKQAKKKGDKKETKQPKSTKIHSVSEKSFCLEVNKVIEASDVVLEVLDARDPLGSRCVEAEQAVLRFPNKRLLFVLNKTDLVPKENVEKWLLSLNKEIPTLSFKCSTQVHERNLKKKRNIIPGRIDVTKGTVCFGSSALLRLLHELCPSKTDGIKVGLIGFANVGKSSLINSLKQAHVCNVGAVKGTTKILQEVNIDSQIKVIDSPGLVVSPNNQDVAITLRSAFQVNDSDVMKAAHVILKHCDKQQVMLQYNIPDFRNPLEFLTLLSRKRGMLKKGGVPDTESAGNLFLNDWLGARLSYNSQPQTPACDYITPEVTNRMQKGINLELLAQDNTESVKALKCPSSASSIRFTSAGLINGVMDVNEIMKQEESEAETEEDEQDMEEEDASEAEEEESQDISREAKTTPEAATTLSKEAPRSVCFDKVEEKVDDTYDFNSDFI